MECWNPISLWSSELRTRPGKEMQPHPQEVRNHTEKKPLDVVIRNDAAPYSRLHMAIQMLV